MNGELRPVIEPSEGMRHPLLLTALAVLLRSGTALCIVRPGYVDASYYAAGTLGHPKLAVDWLVRALAALALGLLPFSAVSDFVWANIQPVILGLESRDDYLSRKLGIYYPDTQYAKESLPPSSLVPFLWEPRTYHCSSNCRPDALLDHWLHAIHLYGRDPGAIADAWYDDGVTHVPLHRAGLNHTIEADVDPVTQADLRVLNELQAEHIALAEIFGSAYGLYRLEEHL